MKEKLIKAYLQTAKIFAELSTAKKLKVGSIVVKDNRIISIGYNGTPSGWNNICEIDKGHVNDVGIPIHNLVTKPEVIHAEMNALLKLAKSTESGEDSSMFCTHSPCMECAKGIYGAGIKEVYYTEDYRSPDGVYFLKKCGIPVFKVDGINN